MFYQRGIATRQALRMASGAVLPVFLSLSAKRNRQYVQPREKILATELILIVWPKQ
jgi:hypothetical protein